MLLIACGSTAPCMALCRSGQRYRHVLVKRKAVPGWRLGCALTCSSSPSPAVQGQALAEACQLPAQTTLGCAT